MKTLFNFFKPKLLSLSLGLVGCAAIQSSAQAPYCSMSYPNGYSSWGMTQVTIGTYSQSPTFGNAYGNFVTQNVPITAGTPTAVSITVAGWASTGIAVDFNNDNDFEDAGETLFFPAYIANNPQAYTGNITVPPSVVSGNYRMRIWTRSANGDGANDGLIPCGTYGYGRYADYKLVVTNTATCLTPSNVQVTPAATTAAISWTASTSAPANYRWKVVAAGADPNTAPPVTATATGTTAAITANATGLTPATSYDAYAKSLCSASDSSVWTLVRNFTTLCDGTPATGVATSSVASVCPTVSFNLVLTGVTAAPGITYQWQSSAVAGGPFTNITGATTTTYAHSQSAPTFYRCVVTCTGSTLTSTSNVINVAINPGTSCYCTPTYTNGCSNGARITSFSTTGATGSNISNLNTACANSGGYSNYTSMTVSGVQTTTFNYSVVVGSYSGGVKIWADWNQDGIFDPVTELIAASASTIASGATFSGTATISATALTGTTRMRVRVVEGATSFNSCDNYSYGETEDYSITVLAATGMCINPLNLAVTAGSITPTAANITFTAPPIGNTPTNFIYELRTDGTLPGSGATGLSANATVTASPVNFTTLDPATNYIFYIRTFCSAGDSSAWVNIPFSTTFDTLTPVSLGQFNSDVIANGIGTAMSSTTNDVDGVSFALVAKDFQATSAAVFPAYAVPNNRIIQNGIRKYRLANYTGNNSLRQVLSTPTGAVRFLAPKRANKVYVLGISGSAISNFNAIVYFADGSTQTQPMNFADWYTSNTNVVVSGVGRINRTNNTLEGTATGGPRMHDSAIVISTANRNKQIDSIVIQRTGTTAGVSNVLAVSIVPNVNQACKLPGYLSIANITCAGGLLSWQGNGVSTNYQVSYGPIGTLANAGTIVSITGATGANTHQFVNGTTNASLQLYVRAVCGTNSYSDWVGPLEVTLPVTAVTPTFTLPADICAGSTAPVLPTTSNNSISGTWSPAVVSNTTSGSYTFTPSALSCAVPVTVSINVPAYTLSPVTDTICVAGATTLNLSPATGYAPGAIAWESSSNGGTTWDPVTGANTVTYTVSGIPSLRRYRTKITQNSIVCYSTIASVDVRNMQITNTVSAERCGPGTVTLSATGNGTQVNWFTSTTSTTPVFSGASFTTPSLTSSATYYVNTTRNGCESQRVAVTATINEQPLINLGNDTLICPGTAVTLNAATSTAGVSRTWNTGATTQTINVTTAGTYSVQVSTPKCTAKDTILIGIAPLPASNLTDTVVICDGTNAVLNAGNTGAAFLWNTGHTTQNLSVTTGGQYAVTVTNTHHCAISDTSFVVVNPVPVVDLGADTTICQNMPHTLDAANTGSDYTWNTGASSQTLSINQAGAYSVTVTNPYNCSKADTILVTIYNGTRVDGFTFAPRFDIAPGRVDFSPVNPQNVNDYLWDFGDGNTSTQQLPSHTYAASGTYPVVLSVSNECGTMDTALTINVDLYLGVANVANNNLNIRVFPVPATDYIKIESKDAGLLLQSATVVNSIGQVVPVTYDKNSQQLKLDLKQLATGNYTIIIETSKGKAYRKFNILK
ncbi:MAG: PKD domain-containing protein [Sphingobacteriales bacterium]|nr:MAG: PKD domain-containing protein [Sphingobacteriales bacterium]